MSDSPSRLSGFRLTRFQYRRDRDIGDSQVRFSHQHAVALELTDKAGRTGLGFAGALFDPMASLAALEATFATHVWPGMDGGVPAMTVSSRSPMCRVMGCACRMPPAGTGPRPIRWPKATSAPARPAGCGQLPRSSAAPLATGTKWRHGGGQPRDDTDQTDG